jgi:hypothetical protein
MRNQKRLSLLKKVIPLPLPPSLEAAFNEIEKPMAHYADSTPEARATAPRPAQDGRSDAR